MIYESLKHSSCKHISHAITAKFWKVLTTAYFKNHQLKTSYQEKKCPSYLQFRLAKRVQTKYAVTFSCHTKHCFPGLNVPLNETSYSVIYQRRN